VERGDDLVVISGTFVLTGTRRRLSAVSVLSAAKGTFTLTGTAATLERGYVLTVAKGTYTEIGIANRDGRGYRLTTAVGAFVLIGNNADLIYSGAGAPCSNYRRRQEWPDFQT